jgi:hypothetical protein
VDTCCQGNQVEPLNQCRRAAGPPTGDCADVGLADLVAEFAEQAERSFVVLDGLGVPAETGVGEPAGAVGVRLAEPVAGRHTGP